MLLLCHFTGALALLCCALTPIRRGNSATDVFFIFIIQKKKISSEMFGFGTLRIYEVSNRLQNKLNFYHKNPVFYRQSKFYLR